jgi:hypothetical protein
MGNAPSFSSGPEPRCRRLRGRRGWRRRRWGWTFCAAAPPAQCMAADQRQRAVGRDPVPGAQLADHVRRCRSGAGAGAGELVAARPYRPATRIQRAERHALLIGRKVQRMRTRSSIGQCLPGLGLSLQIQISAERAHRAVVIRVLDVTEQRIARREAVVEPSSGGVRDGAGAVGIDSVALGKLLHIKLGEPLHRSADVSGDGAHPIFKTVVVTHAPHVDRRASWLGLTPRCLNRIGIRDLRLSATGSQRPVRTARASMPVLKGAPIVLGRAGPHTGQSSPADRS